MFLRKLKRLRRLWGNSRPRNREFFSGEQEIFRYEQGNPVKTAADIPFLAFVTLKARVSDKIAAIFAGITRRREHRAVSARNGVR